jgi:hypothetical protein
MRFENGNVTGIDGEKGVFTYKRAILAHPNRVKIGMTSYEFDSSLDNSAMEGTEMKAVSKLWTW